VVTVAFLTLYSPNPHFSYIIRKNPESGMQIKSVRNGYMCGWFSGEQSYSIFFNDDILQISYPEKGDLEFEYGNRSRYNSPVFVIDAITEFLRSAYKEGEEHDIEENYFNAIIIGAMPIHQRYYDIICDAFTMFSLHKIPIQHNVHRVVFSGFVSIQHLLNCTLIFSLFMGLKSNAFYYKVDENQIKRYLECFSYFRDIPYLLRYIFKVNFLRTKSLFDKYHADLELSSRGDVYCLSQGYNVDARTRYVEQHISPEDNVLDIGCGEGAHLFTLGAKRKASVYVGIDTNEEIIAYVHNKIEKKQLENVHAYSSLDEWFSSQEEYGNDETKYTVLLSEVIEHMPLDALEELFTILFAHVNIHKVIITTPNKYFNLHYGLDEDEMRHEDHVQEFSKEEVMSLCTQIIPKVFQGSYNITYTQIGDIVNNASAQHGLVMERGELFHHAFTTE
jgi:small RNA 2'-O-methyltransferase